MCVSLNSRSLSYNGSRLAAGDLPAGARVWTTGPARQGHNTPLPLRRSSPASFERLLRKAIADLVCSNWLLGSVSRHVVLERHGTRLGMDDSPCPLGGTTLRFLQSDHRPGERFG